MSPPPASPAPPAEAAGPTLAGRLSTYVRGGGVITPVITALFAFFVGGLVVASSGPPTDRRLVIVAASFGTSVLIAAIMPTIGSVFVVMPFVGAASVAVISLSNATLQLNSDPKLRGRVMAIFSMALIGSTPIGGPLMGWIGETVSARVSLLIGGFAALVAALYGWWNLTRSVTGIEDAIGIGERSAEAAASA